MQHDVSVYMPGVALSIDSSTGAKSRPNFKLTGKKNFLQKMLMKSHLPYDYIKVINLILHYVLLHYIKW
jgi:hypothetical protein